MDSVFGFGTHRSDLKMGEGLTLKCGLMPLGIARLLS
jgi:hypothetical protein